MTKSVFDRVVDILDNLADMVSLGAATVKEVKEMKENPPVQAIREEADNRVADIQDARARRRAREKGQQS